MFEIDGSTLSTVFDTNFCTKTITFFGVTFSTLEKFKIDAYGNYSIQELSFTYCKGLNDTKGNIRTIIDAISKNKDLSKSLKAIKLFDNKLESEQDIKDALVKTNLENVELFFKEPFKNVQKHQQTTNIDNEGIQNIVDHDNED